MRKLFSTEMLFIFKQEILEATPSMKTDITALIVKEVPKPSNERLSIARSL